MYVSDTHRECVELLEEFDELTPLFQAPADVNSAKDAVIETLEIAEVWAELREQPYFLKTLKDAQERVASTSEISTVADQLNRAVVEIQGLIRSFVGEPQTEEYEPVSFEDPQMAVDFIVEAREHQQNIDVKLLELEANPESKEAFESVYRSLHTIKGMAGFLRLTQCQDLARAAETILDTHQKQEVTLTSLAIDALLDASHLLQDYIDRLHTTVENGAQMEFDPEIPRLVQMMYSIHPAKVPARLGEILVHQGGATEDHIQHALKQQKSSEHKEQLGAILVRDLNITAKTVARGLRAQKAMKPPIKVLPTVRIQSARLDELGDLVGELTVLESMIQATAAELRNDRLRGQLSEIKRVVNRLHDLAGQLRAIPVQNLFEKMRRLARDVGQKTHKEVKVTLEGGDTEVDKSIVDALSDPMIHLVRNAIDHGLESPKDRAEQGKLPQGNLTLRAFQRSGHLVIEVQDDGKGLDRDELIAKAIEKGLLEQDRAISTDAVYRLVFSPGFSTKSKVSDISGRGVGMDVVAKTVERFGGRIDVRSEKYKGTTMSLHFPLTLAVLDGLLVKVQEHRYVVPIRNVVRSVRPKPADISTVMDQGELLRYGSEFFPIARIRERLGIAGETESPEDAFLILVEASHQRGALLVDEILGQQRVVVRGLGEGIGKVQGIGGAAVMPDGRVGLIFDIGEILNMSA